MIGDLIQTRGKRQTKLLLKPLCRFNGEENVALSMPHCSIQGNTVEDDMHMVVVSVVMPHRKPLVFADIYTNIL